jgi:hypothetical protein
MGFCEGREVERGVLNRVVRYAGKSHLAGYRLPGLENENGMKKDSKLAILLFQARVTHSPILPKKSDEKR